MSDLANRLNRSFRGASGSVDIATSDSGTITLSAAADASHRIYVEALTVTIITDAAHHITFQDSAGTPVNVQETADSPGAGKTYQWTWPGGRPLTMGKDFVAVLSAAGLAATIQWRGHQRTT